MAIFGNIAYLLILLATLSPPTPPPVSIAPSSLSISRPTVIPMTKVDGTRIELTEVDFSGKGRDSLASELRAKY